MPFDRLRVTRAGSGWWGLTHEGQFDQRMLTDALIQQQPHSQLPLLRAHLRQLTFRSGHDSDHHSPAPHMRLNRQIKLMS